MLRQCDRPRAFLAIFLLASCTAAPPAPAPVAKPIVLAPAGLSPSDLRAAERHAYWQGYAAGRHVQKQQDAQLVAARAIVPAAAPAATPAQAAPPPLHPVPAPVDGYYANGPAQPIATPVN